MPAGIGYKKKVKVDPKSKLGKNIKKDRVKIKQTTQDRLDEAETKKKGKKTNTQTKQDRLDEAEGKKKGKMKFKVVKKAEKAPVKKAPKKIKFVVDVDPEKDTEIKQDFSKDARVYGLVDEPGFKNWRHPQSIGNLKGAELKKARKMMDKRLHLFY